MPAERGANVPGRPLRPRDWVPDQHGAWAMLLLPLLLGVASAGPAPVHAPLAGFWLSGYLAFHALGRRLRSRRPPPATPLLVSAAAATVFGVATLLAAPGLARWIPLFLPLVGVSLWATATGRERSLTNDTVTVLAACLMAPVAFDAGDGQATAELWRATGVLTLYFLGTVLYVKTMIRERGRPGYVLASVGAHAAVTALAAALALTGQVAGWTVVAGVLLTVRAAAGPAINRHRSRPLRPVVVGVGEIVASLALTAALLLLTTAP